MLVLPHYCFFLRCFTSPSNSSMFQCFLFFLLVLGELRRVFESFLKGLKWHAIFFNLIHSFIMQQTSTLSNITQHPSTSLNIPQHPSTSLNISLGISSCSKPQHHQISLNIPQQYVTQQHHATQQHGQSTPHQHGSTPKTIVSANHIKKQPLA